MFNLFGLEITLDPFIMIVVSVFITTLSFFIVNAIKIKTKTSSLTKFLKTFKKADLAYRFKELDENLTADSFICNYWLEFKNTLVFGENIALKTDEGKLFFDSISQKASNIYCTVDAVYFFNEETLVHNKMNYKFISSMPTLLTGLGPLFTFLNIAMSFAKVDFSSQENTLKSVSGLMSCMHAAALVSVIAVSSALIFIFVEKILYNSFCKKPIQEIQIEINKLFDSISPEKFLVELLKESKIQNNALNNMFKALPTQMKGAFDQSITTNLVPYLDNLIYSINKLQETNKSSKNIIDDLFKTKD